MEVIYIKQFVCMNTNKKPNVSINYIIDWIPILSVPHGPESYKATPRNALDYFEKFCKIKYSHERE